MNKRYKMLVVIVLAAVVLTGLSYFVRRSGQQVYCAPANPGPLDELSAAHQMERGFPFAYYVERVPENCYIQDVFASADADAGSRFSPAKLLLDVVIWSVLLALFAPVVRSREKK